MEYGLDIMVSIVPLIEYP